MKEVIYRNRTSPKKKCKAISISETSESKKYNYHVQKAFIYTIGEKLRREKCLPSPEYFITRFFDSAEDREKFIFRTKGLFYLVKDNSFFEIHFCHSLRIDCVPKTKRSPDKLDADKLT